MSWIFFNKRKPSARLNTDREFELPDVGKYSELEMNTKKLYKDMKRYNESLAELSKFESKIAQDISITPLDQEKEGRNHGEELGTTLKNLERYRLELTTNVAKTTIEPLKKFSGVFPNMNNGLKKREHCLQDYKRLIGKVEKYSEREKSPLNTSKLEQYEKELESAKADYKAHNDVMLEELPRLWESRITYFEPCFEALQKSQVDYYSKCCQAYGDLVECLSSGTLVNRNAEPAQNDGQVLVSDWKKILKRSDIKDIESVVQEATYLLFAEFPDPILIDYGQRKQQDLKSRTKLAK